MPSSRAFFGEFFFVFSIPGFSGGWGLEVFRVKG